MTGIPVGGLLLPHLLTSLQTTFGWRGTHLILAGIVLVCIALPTWLIIRNSPQEAGVESEIGEAPLQALEPHRQWSTRDPLSKGVLARRGTGCRGHVLDDRSTELRIAPRPVCAARACRGLFAFGMFGAMLMGWIRDRSGSYNLALMVGVAAMIFAALLIVWLPRANIPRGAAVQAPSAS